jgi:preprotein translocase subunit YajC
MSVLFQVLASSGAPAGGSGTGPGFGGAGGMQSLIFLLLIIVVFYFFMIRPQVRKQKEATNFRNTLKKGDKVATTGGIYGRITDVKESTVTLEIADNVLVKVDKTALIADPGEQAAAKK